VFASTPAVAWYDEGLQPQAAATGRAASRRCSDQHRAVAKVLFLQLVPGLQGIQWHVYVYDRAHASSTLLNYDTYGGEADGDETAVEACRRELLEELNDEPNCQATDDAFRKDPTGHVCLQQHPCRPDRTDELHVWAVIAAQTVLPRLHPSGNRPADRDMIRAKEHPRIPFSDFVHNLTTRHGRSAYAGAATSALTALCLTLGRDSPPLDPPRRHPRRRRAPPCRCRCHPRVLHRRRLRLTSRPRRAPRRRRRLRLTSRHAPYPRRTPRHPRLCLAPLCRRLRRRLPRRRRRWQRRQPRCARQPC
jgi:ADP-ribose pyrophosphatase YjhB (NUDIX family)